MSEKTERGGHPSPRAEERGGHLAIGLHGLWSRWCDGGMVLKFGIGRITCPDCSSLRQSSRPPPDPLEQVTSKNRSWLDPRVGEQILEPWVGEPGELFEIGTGDAGPLRTGGFPVESEIRGDVGRLLQRCAEILADGQ